MRSGSPFSHSSRAHSLCTDVKAAGSEKYPGGGGIAEAPARGKITTGIDQKQTAFVGCFIEDS